MVSGLSPLAEADQSALEAVSDNISQTIDKISNTPLEVLLQELADFAKRNIPKLLIAIVVFIIGLVLVKYLLHFLRKALKKSKINITLHSFVTATVKTILYILLIIICVRIVGIEITPLLTVIGAAGLALSLAVKDSLANVAAGISLLFSRPFGIGDYVEVDGLAGTVKELGLVYTLLITLDNRHTYLPNNDVAKATVINYSAEPKRRLDLVFNIRDSSDFSYVKSMMLEEIGQNNLVLKEPVPVIRISDQTFRYIQMTCMVWVATPDLLELKSQLISSIRTRISMEQL